MTLVEIQNDCKAALTLCTDNGKFICDKGEYSIGNHCTKCGYSNYWHLVKKVAHAD